MATVKLYHATGFTTTNLPFSLDVIDKRAKSVTTVEGIDIIQVYGLTSIRIAADEKTILDVDYCSIEDGDRKAFYAVTGYVITSIDVAALDLVLDPFSSLGGWDTLFVDAGAVIRSNVSRFFRNSEMYGSDPYLVQAHYPDYNFEFIKFGKDDSINSELEIVALTVDPESAIEARRNLYNITGTVTEGSVNYTVKPPTKMKSAAATDLTLDMSYRSYPLDYHINTVGYGLYDLSNATVKDALSALYQLSMQDAIIGAYRIPRGLFTATIKSGHIGQLTFGGGADDINMPLRAKENYTQIQKDVLNRLDWAKDGILSVSNGEKLEHRYSEAGDKVFVTADMHPDGFLIFSYPPKGTNDAQASGSGIDAFADRFAMLKFWGITSDTWASVPMVASGLGSGKAIAQLQANQAAGDMRLQYQQEIQRGHNDLSRISNVSGLIGSVASGDVGGAISSAIGFATSEQAVQLSERSMQQARDIRRREKANELAGFYADYYYKAPTVTGIETNHLQEYVGPRQLIAYTVRPHTSDMYRFTGVARNFGLSCMFTINKHTTIVGIPDREDGYEDAFQYVQTSGIKFEAKAGAPNYLIQAANDACNTGCRFWRE